MIFTFNCIWLLVRYEVVINVHFLLVTGHAAFSISRHLDNQQEMCSATWHWNNRWQQWKFPATVECFSQCHFYPRIQGKGLQRIVILNSFSLIVSYAQARSQCQVPGKSDNLPFMENRITRRWCPACGTIGNVNKNVSHAAPEQFD